VCKQWQKLWFHGEQFSKELSIAPYQYKMIRGVDFYNYCLDEIARHPNFTIRFEKVDHVFSSDITTGITVNDTAFHCQYVFNSILFERPQLSAKQYWLLQHFKGWIIETEKAQFDVNVATMMDFRIDQQSGTAFCYVLPLSSTKALIEYTLFSPQLLPEEKYNIGLKFYIGDVLKLQSYKIVDEEFGMIPMTNFKFSTRQNNIVNIGTAGGQTKASSGYTFNFIQKHSHNLVQKIIETGEPLIAATASRYSFYDSVLLNILFNSSLPGRSIFTDLFKKNEAIKVLKFLDNETSFAEELKIISTLPTWPFTKAAIKQIF
jgi:lycopene beta-cyclase